MIHIIKYRTTEDVTAPELKQSLIRCPDCVIVAGKISIFKDRQSELNIDMYRGGGLGFAEQNWGSKKSFIARELTVMGQAFTIFHSLNGISPVFFKSKVSNEEIEEAIKKSYPPSSEQALQGTSCARCGKSMGCFLP